jgi:tetratricopeptide (TPR) repeat protein
MSFAAVVVALSQPVRAQPAATDIDEAERLFGEAHALLNDKRYAEACAKFDESFKRGHLIGAELHLGNCAERDGQLALAWRLFDAAARDWESEDDAPRARAARVGADRVATRLATITVTLPDPSAVGVTVRIGQRTVAPAPEIRELVEPGDVEVVVDVPGRPPVRRVVHARAGTVEAIDVSAATAYAAPEPRRDRGPSNTGELALGITAIALAGGSLALWRLGAATYEKALNTPEDTEQDARYSRATLQYYAADGLAIASVVCGGAAVWLYVRHRSQESSAAARAARLHITPVLAGDRMGLVLAGSY